MEWRFIFLKFYDYEKGLDDKVIDMMANSWQDLDLLLWFLFLDEVC